MRRLRQRAVRNGGRSAVHTRKFSKRKQRDGEFSSYSKAKVVFCDIIIMKLSNCTATFKRRLRCNLSRRFTEFYLFFLFIHPFICWIQVAHKV